MRFPSSLKLAANNHGEILRSGDSFTLVTEENGELKFAPLTEGKCPFPGIPPSVLSAVRFPEHVRLGASTDEILRAAEGVITEFADFAGDGARCLALALLTAWFADLIATPPTIVLISPTPAAGAAVLTTCGLLCRRPIVVTADTAPHVAPWGQKMGATLLVDATAASSRSLRWAAGLNAPGLYSHLEEELVETVGVRIFLGTDALPFPDALQLPILQGRIAAPPSPAQQARIARDVAAAMVGYRVRSMARFQPADSSLVADPNGVALLERTITECIFDDEPLKNSIGPLLLRHLGFRNGLEAESNSRILLEVLISFVHDRKKQITFPEIVDRVKTLTEMRGNSENGNRIIVGRQMAKLGIRTVHTNLGNVVALDGPTRHAIHKAAWNCGVLSQKNLLANCLYCKWCRGEDGLGVASEGLEDSAADEGCEESELSEDSEPH